MKKTKTEIREDVSSSLDFSSLFDSAEKSALLPCLEVNQRRDPKTAIHSGSLCMDLVILGGGFYPGRIYEYVGPEHGGKTSMGTEAFACGIQFIPNNTIGYYGDIEGTLDTMWFVNIANKQVKDKLLTPNDIFGKRSSSGWEIKPKVRLLKPSNGEQYLRAQIKVLNSLPDKIMLKNIWYYKWTPVDAATKKKTGGLVADDIKALLSSLGVEYDAKLYKSNGVYCVPVPNNYAGADGIWLTDSLVALTPKQIAEDDSNAMGAQARMFSRYINTIKTLISAKAFVGIHINQSREKIGVLYGNPEYQPGGNAIKFVCDCRNRIAPCANPNGKGYTEVIGNNEYRWTVVKNLKNKIYLPYKSIKFRWWTERNGKTGCGIDPVQDTIQFLELTGQIQFIRKKGVRVCLKDDSKPAKKLADITFTNAELEKSIVENKLFFGENEVPFSLHKHCLTQIRSGVAFDYLAEMGIPDDVVEEIDIVEED